MKEKDKYHTIPTVKHGVVASCFGGVFLHMGQGDYTVLRRGWLGPCFARFWGTTSL